VALLLAVLSAIAVKMRAASQAKAGSGAKSGGSAGRTADEPVALKDVVLA
jgi:hypothetical protein